MKTLVIGAMLAASLTAAPAAALTYVGSYQTADGWTGSLQVQTSGRIGVLSASDIVSWVITITSPTGNDSGIWDSSHGQVQVGTGVSATASDIRFDFDHGSQIRFVMNGASLQWTGSQSSGNGFYIGIAGHGALVSANGTGSILTAPAFTSGPETGGVVPEPATWALMIAGFGLVGCAARRRAATA